MKKILIINGPNINLVGKREKKIYGNKNYKTIKKIIYKFAKKIKIIVKIKQFNSEKKMIKSLYHIKNVDYIIINPAGYSYNNISILDMLLSTKIPYIEIHISNIFNRINRNKSIFSINAFTVIIGANYKGYLLALFLCKIIK